MSHNDWFMLIEYGKFTDEKAAMAAMLETLWANMDAVIPHGHAPVSVEYEVEDGEAFLVMLCECGKELVDGEWDEHWEEMEEQDCPLCQGASLLPVLEEVGRVH